MSIVRKHSKKRDAILEVIRSTKTHPTAQWVYEQLKPRILDLSLGTVYRNINLFKQEETVCSVATVDGEDRVDGNVAPHPHLICEKCSRVIDLPPADIATTCLTSVGRNYKIDYRKTVYYGLCDECVEA